MKALLRYQAPSMPPPGFEATLDEEELFPEIRNPLQRRFLMAVCATGRPSAAAELTQINLRSHYVWMYADATPYKAAFERAKVIAADRLEEAAWLGAEGNTRNSALLLMFLLNAYKPDRFKYKYAPDVEPATPALEERARQANERLMRLRRDAQQSQDTQAD
jgi:hypothetical protein